MGSFAKVARLAVIVGVVGVVATFPVGAWAADTVSGYGINALQSEWLAGYNSGPGLDPNGVADLRLMGSSGIKLYRARFREDQVLTSDGFTQWTMQDNLVSQAARQDVTLLPIFMNMPGEAYTPPKGPDDIGRFAAFAAAAVQRYGPGGSFWSGCGCPPHPIRAWQVWNEENVQGFWAGPSPSGYAALLVATRSALRSVDPGARVVFGSLAYPATQSATELGPNAFLRDVIRAAGPDSFDALALDSYNPDPGVAVNGDIKGTVGALKKYAGTGATGTPRQQVWVTEFGQPTSPNDPSTTVDELAVSEQTQLAWENTFLDKLLPRRTAWNLGPVLWYCLRDAPSPTAAWMRLGLRQTKSDGSDLGPKPAWDAYATRSSAAAALPLPDVH
jgi:polysaccharide biosynthesis protein PslG